MIEREREEEEEKEERKDTKRNKVKEKKVCKCAQWNKVWGTGKDGSVE